MMRTVVVTGASAGIGAAIAAERIAAGWRVLNVARRPAGIAGVDDIAADLGTDAGIEAAAAAAADATALVHNAGLIRPAPLGEVVLADLDQLVHVHLKTAIRLAQVMLPAMRAQGHGRIVLIASRAALGLAGRTAYSATKAGMIGMARTWALELAPLNITVNVVSPGPIETDMLDALVPEAAKARLAAAIPTGRLGRAEDVAAAVAFFLSDTAGFVTGQNLFVCGGTSVGSLTL